VPRSKIVMIRGPSLPRKRDVSVSSYPPPKRSSPCFKPSPVRHAV
jgi:hypothetical protein